MTLTWAEVPLDRPHDRAAFDCGEADLNAYLQRYARQNHESGGAKCFVATPTDAPARILGFYTLSPASLIYARTPAIVSKGLGRYDVPVFRLGRLAVDRAMQGRGLGGALLLRAAERCMRVAQEVGGVALLIDAKSENAATRYAGYGAVPLLDAPLSLVLPFRIVADALAQRTERHQRAQRLPLYAKIAHCNIRSFGSARDNSKIARRSRSLVATSHDGGGD